MRFLAVLACHAAVAAGCSLLYPFDLPDVGDAGGGEADDGSGDDGNDAGGDEGEVSPICGNGRVDPGELCDTALPRSCTTSCDSPGTQDCGVDCRSVTCVSPAEFCNGADDDCDGVTDNGYACAAGLSVSCATPCGVAGTAPCTAACEVPPPWECVAAAEACNGCDDDRDGATDEDCPCAADWVVEHPLAPGPQSLLGISIAGGVGFAVGTAGRILEWNGSRWAADDSPVAYDLEEVHVVSPALAVAAGQNATVLWWEGGSWRFDPGPGDLTTGRLFGVHAVAADDVWAVGPNGTVVHWDGSAWSRVDSHTTRHLYGVWAWDANNVYAVGTSGTVLRWDGSDWQSIAPAWLTREMETVWGPDATTVYVGGIVGTIARWDRDSGTWTPAMPTGTLETIYDFWGSGPDDIWAVGGWSGGTVLHYDGMAWTEDGSVPSLDAGGLVGVSGGGPDDVFVVGREGGILHRDGDGAEWRPMEGNVTVSLRAVWGTSPQDVFAMGVATSGDGTASTAVLRYDGTAWTFPHWLPGVDGRDLWASSPSDVYLVAANGNIPHYDGSAWDTLNVGFAGIDLLGVWGLDPADVFVVGGQTYGDEWPAVFESRGGGWTPLVVRPELPFVDHMAVHGTSADTVFAVGTGGTIVRRAAGEDYMDQLVSGTGQALRGLWVFSDTDAFAVGDGGTILRWDGTTWTSMTQPTDPWSGFRLNAVWGSSPDSVFAVGEMSTVLRHDETGWTRLPVELLIDLTGVWGSSATNVFVVADDRSGKIVHRCGTGW